MNTDYKLILNDITINESLAFPTDFEKYKHMAFLYLNHKEKHLFGEEILSRYNRTMTLERLVIEEPDHFIQGSNKKKNGKTQITWYDIQSQDEILPKDDFFDFFFACKLRQLNLLEISNFLSDQLEHNFRTNKKKFLSFLNVCLSQQERLLNVGILASVKEWINELTQPLKEEDEKVKGRPPREAGDRLTSLNLNQTALLIQLMQETRIIFKEEYLTYAQAGKAFNLLTGFSSHTIRHQLGAKGEINGAKHEDYKELHQVLSHLLRLIESKVLRK